MADSLVFNYIDAAKKKSIETLLSLSDIIKDPSVLDAIKDVSIIVYDDTKIKNTINDVSIFAHSIRIPIAVSSFINDKGYVVRDDISDFVTNIELERKGYLTDHQPLDEYAKFSDIDNIVSNIDSSIISVESSKQDKFEVGVGLSLEDGILSSTIDNTLFRIVNELPISNIEDNKIYLLSNHDSSPGNIYVEYVHTPDGWEKIGDLKMTADLSNYYTKNEIDTTVADISTNIGSLQNALNTKAESHIVDNLQIDMRDKANQEDLLSLQNELQNKADRSELDAKANANIVEYLIESDRTQNSTILEIRDIVNNLLERIQAIENNNNGEDDEENQTYSVINAELTGEDGEEVTLLNNN